MAQPLWFEIASRAKAMRDTMLVQVDPSLPRSVGQAWRVVPRPRAGRRMWQFKNGSVAPIAHGHEDGALEAARFMAWDRSLCAEVFYA